MVMMAPVSAGTDSVVPVMNRVQAMPASAAGSAVIMMKGSTQDWKLTTINRIYQHDRHHQADAQTLERSLQWCAPGPRNEVRAPRRQFGLDVLHQRLDVGRHAAQIAPPPR